MEFYDHLNNTHEGVLTGKSPTFPGLLRVTLWFLLQSSNWVVYSMLHGTLSEGLRYFYFKFRLIVFDNFLTKKFNL